MTLFMTDGIHRMSHETSAVVSNLSGYLSNFTYVSIYAVIDLFPNLVAVMRVKFDIDDTGSILLYGGGAVIALWLSSALIPKLLEVVGLGYTLWFTYRYLLFKKNRDKLATKIEELKARVLGSDD
ncbi:hypothetical protein K1719_003639 [Acacia pycnantha]|nr:hypothetical protein K1719_003639 [Acacia pycnantha]